MGEGGLECGAKMVKIQMVGFNNIEFWISGFRVSGSVF